MGPVDAKGSRGAAWSTRREFLAAGTAPLIIGGLARAAEPAPPPTQFDRKIKIGLIGAGGRGRWIANLFRQHGGFEFHAVADYFQDVAVAAGKALGVEDARCFGGLQGYKKLIASGVEAVIIIDVPWFYPEQAKAAVVAGCHVYTAKPVATDVPGVLAIGDAGKLATQKKLCFLADYQMPTAPANIEVATRIWGGALGPLAHATSTGFAGQWADPPRGATIENLLRGGAWLSDTALSGDSIVSYDIHAIDAAVWVLRQRPVAASGASRQARPNPQGDYRDVASVVFEMPDGVIWTHRCQSLTNNEDSVLLCQFHGQSANAQINYWGKAFVRGGDKHYSGSVDSLYDTGAQHNVATFYQSIAEGRFGNPTVQRAVDGTLAAILGREAAARHTRLTMDELLKENKRLEVNLEGLKA